MVPKVITTPESKRTNNLGTPHPFRDEVRCLAWVCPFVLGADPTLRQFRKSEEKREEEEDGGGG